MFRSDPEPIGSEHFRDLCNGTTSFESEVAHNDISFVDQNTRSFLELGQIDPRIDITVIICAADHDVRRLPRWIAEKSPDPVRGRSHFLYDFLEFLDHLAGLADRL